MLDPKEAVFIQPPQDIGGLSARPMTAETLIILKQTGNALIKGGGGNGTELDVAAFLYIHTADPREVRRVAFDADKFRERVLEFAGTIKVSDFAKAAELIKRIVEQSVVGMDYEVEGESGPNLSARVGSPAMSSASLPARDGAEISSSVN